MTIWSTRSGRNCSMRASARLGRLSVGACAMPREDRARRRARADAFGQEDGVPAGQGGVGRVAGWMSAAPVEGDVDGHARGKRVEVGVGARAFDALVFVEGAHACEGAPPGVHVRGRVGDVHGLVAPSDAREDVDLPAEFRADEGTGQVDAARLVAGEGELREESTGVSSPVRADQDALVGAAPRQAHDVEAAAHCP